MIGYLFCILLLIYYFLFKNMWIVQKKEKSQLDLTALIENIKKAIISKNPFWRDELNHRDFHIQELIPFCSNYYFDKPKDRSSYLIYFKVERKINAPINPLKDDIRDKSLSLFVQCSYEWKVIKCFETNYIIKDYILNWDDGEEVYQWKELRFLKDKYNMDKDISYQIDFNFNKKWKDYNFPIWHMIKKKEVLNKLNMMNLSLKNNLWFFLTLHTSSLSTKLFQNIFEEIQLAYESENNNTSPIVQQYKNVFDYMIKKQKDANIELDEVNENNINEHVFNDLIRIFPRIDIEILMSSFNYLQTYSYKGQIENHYEYSLYKYFNIPYGIYFEDIRDNILNDGLPNKKYIQYKNFFTKENDITSNFILQKDLKSNNNNTQSAYFGNNKLINNFQDYINTYSIFNCIETTPYLYWWNHSLNYYQKKI